MILSPDQGDAMGKISAWLRDPRAPQDFYLAGPAGTGKSTVAAAVLASVNGRAVTATYTGKAAHVLRRKGVDAQTIHSLIYEPIPFSDPVEFRLAEESALHDADLLVLDECFVGTTLVDTPVGSVNISDICPGDLIYNAYGIDRVVAVYKRKADKIAQINTGGITYTCSADHRFFTERGIVRARDIRLGERLASTISCLRSLRNYFYSDEQLDCEVLPEKLRHALECAVSRMEREIQRRLDAEKYQRSPCLALQSRGCASLSVAEERGIEAVYESRNRKEDGGNKQTSRQFYENTSRWKWYRPNTAPAIAVDYPGPKISIGILSELGKAPFWLSDSLQVGFGRTGKEDRYRSEWLVPQTAGSNSKRSEKDRSSKWARVESIKLLESRDPRLDSFRDADGELHLYDIQAERHHSFSVNGTLVHNCSMVDDQVATDLRSFGKKMLVIGDPAQLPPIRSAGAFTRRPPDHMFHEIHRQAAESPILRLATAARLGQRLPDAMDEPGAIIRRVNVEDALREDYQVICGVHRVRWNVTARIRAARGFEGVDPSPGERVLCCRNNRELGLYNGAMGEVVGASQLTHTDQLRLRVRMEDQATAQRLLISRVPFREHGEGRLPVEPYSRQVDLFDFGYCLTAHKAQGSEWDNVVVIDDSESFREDRNRWLYTSITRASRNLILLRR